MRIWRFLCSPGFLAFLRTLDGAYHGLVDDPTETAARAPSRGTEAAPLVSRVEIAKLPAPSLRDEARRHTSDARALVGLRVQWGILGAVVLFTLVTFLQLQQTRSERGSDDRPFVVLVPLSIGPDAAKAGSVKAVFAVQDLGRSPALHVRSVVQVFVGDSSKDLTPAEESFYTGDPTWTTNYVAIAPTTTGDDRITIDDAFLPATPQMQRAVGTDGGIKGVARVEYTDMQGQIYVAEACAYRTMSGEVATCDNHNGVR